MTRTVRIDGVRVKVLVNRLTVRELEDVTVRTAAGWISKLTPAQRDKAQLKRFAVIDEHVTPAPGELLVDDRPVKEFGPYYGARADVTAALGRVLFEAQTPSKAERRQLSIAIRFSEYVADVQQRRVPSKWARTGADCGKCRKLKLCGERHCDGSVGKRLVWYDAKHKLRTCPVLSFTPVVTNLIRLFAWTHEITYEAGIPRYRRIALPDGVALGDQDAWTMTALGVARDEYNGWLAEQTRARHARAEDE